VPVTVSVQFVASSNLPVAMSVSTAGATITSATGTTVSGMSAQFVVR
jgi:hypothetical protein